MQVKVRGVCSNIFMTDNSLAEKIRFQLFNFVCQDAICLKLTAKLTRNKLNELKPATQRRIHIRETALMLGTYTYTMLAKKCSRFLASFVYANTCNFGLVL